MDLLMDADQDINTFNDKTVGRYKMTYTALNKWKEAHGYSVIDEDVLLAYFTNASQTFQYSTLKSMHSMLKKTIQHKDNIDILTYSRLNDFLKEKTVPYERGKGKVFSASEIKRFLFEAPDTHYLAMKVSGNGGKPIFLLHFCRFIIKFVL